MAHKSASRSNRSGAAFATILAGGWNRSNFFWVTFQYRRRKNISVASNGSEVQSMIEPESSHAEFGTTLTSSASGSIVGTLATVAEVGRYANRSSRLSSC